MTDRDRRTQKAKSAVETFRALREAVDIISFFVEKAIRKHGLTPSQFYILKTIKEAGPSCQKRLGELLIHTGGNVTVVSKLLEKRKLIKRTKNPGDKRMFTVTLTNLGDAALVSSDADYRKALEGLMSNLSSHESETLTNTCGKFFDKLAGERVKIIRSYRPPVKEKKKKK